MLRPHAKHAREARAWCLCPLQAHAPSGVSIHNQQGLASVASVLDSSMSAAAAQSMIDRGISNAALHSVGSTSLGLRLLGAGSYSILGGPGLGISGGTTSSQQASAGGARASTESSGSSVSSATERVLGMEALPTQRSAASMSTSMSTCSSAGSAATSPRALR